MCEVHLGVVVEVPEVQAPGQVHAGEQGGMGGGPHHVVHVVAAVLKRVQRTGALRGRDASDAMRTK